ncbi:MAG: diaminopimelate decarboxylase [Planctomycetota bacterium]
MADKTLPFDRDELEQIAAEHPTPFHLYDEAGIRGRMRQLRAAFAWNEGFRQCFAVKATPNPHIVGLLREEGSDADCSSLAELILCERIGLAGESVMFTSNNTSVEELAKARELGAVINLDSPIYLDKFGESAARNAPDQIPTPEVISFRFNPGPEKAGNVIIGDPAQAKFGCTRPQILDGYRRAAAMGVQRFGLHTMVVSNERSLDSLLETARMLFELSVLVHREAGVRIESINLGGGIGVAYHPDDTELDIAAFGHGVRDLYEQILEPAGLAPTNILMENGRAITGPFGYLVSRVINVKETYKKYVGVDANMANLMRPGMYGAYHHISVLKSNDGGKEGGLTETVDVVGALCENNDKFAIDRELPPAEAGDLVVIHDAGAHGHSMGFQYNGRLRSAELLLKEDGSIQQIRRAETLDDYFATVEFPAPAEATVGG